MADQPKMCGRLAGSSILAGLILLINLMICTSAETVPSVDLDAAVADLEAKLDSASDPAALRPLLAVTLVRRASSVAASEAKPDRDRLMKLLGEFRRAIKLAPDHPDVWLAYLTFLLSRPDQVSAAATEGQTALDTVIPGLARPLPAVWRAVVEKLETLYSTYDMPLFRLQCLELLARGDGAGAASASKLLMVARETASRRTPEVLSSIDVSLSLGDLRQAQILLNGLRRLDPALPALPALEQRLRTARKVEYLLTSMYRAMRESRPALARDLCEQVLRLEANNPQARTMLGRLSGDAVATAAAAIGDETARKQAMIIGLLEKLDAAFARDDILEARRILREFEALGISTPAQKTRMRHIEQDLLESRFLVAQRFDEAQSLFENRQWEKLRRLLNRNPAIGNSTERLIRVWEMGLVADSELAWKDPETLIAEADRLEEKAPGNFWSKYVKMKVALDQGRYADAETLLEAALAVKPDSRFLTWPSRILWLWRHGWKFVPFVLLALVFVIGRSMSAFFDWWERSYWTRIAFIARFLPSHALGSLEKRLPSVREIDEKLVLYRLLARCAFAAGETAKGIRYAEMILELRPTDLDAISMLGRHYLKLPSQTPTQFAFVMGYAAHRPEDRDLIEKIGKSVLAGRAVTPEMLPVLGRYTAFFPKDDRMARILEEYYRSADPMTLTAESIDFIEKSWRGSGAEETWYVLLRALVVHGLFDRFEHLVEEAAAGGRAGEWWRLFELADRQTESELSSIRTALGSAEKDRMTGAMQKALAFRFVKKKHFKSLADALDGYGIAEDVGIRYHAQKSLDFLRSQTMKTEAFLAAMASRMPSPEAETVSPREERMMTPPPEPEIVQPDRVEPETGSVASDGGAGLFDDHDEVPPSTDALPDAGHDESPAAASTTGERIGRLPDDPDMSDVRKLVEESTNAEIVYWKEYIDRSLSREVVETLPKLLARLHAAELVPVFAKLLESPFPRVRANAVEALEENDHQEAIPIFITLLRDDDNRIRANAIKAMAKFGAEKMLEELRGMIEDPRVEMRDSATYVLKGIRGRDAAILLEHLLRDGSALVRFNAIRSLAAQGDPGNTQRLMEYLPEVADPEERDLLLETIARLQQSG